MARADRDVVTKATADDPHAAIPAQVHWKRRPQTDEATFLIMDDLQLREWCLELRHLAHDIVARQRRKPEQVNEPLKDDERSL